MRFQVSPSPELFSSDESVVTQVGNESLDDVRCEMRGMLVEKKSMTSPRGLEVENPGE